MLTLIYIALGAATGLCCLAAIVIAMKVREDQQRRLIDADYMTRTQDWGGL